MTSSSADLAAAPRLHGDLAIWLVIAAELLTFGLMFVSYAFARAHDPVLFNAMQAGLDLWSGGVNTVLLITGSWCVARAVLALAQDSAHRGAHWLLAAMACGGGFVVIKWAELSAKFALGIELSTNTFWMFYLLLTIFHFLHVVAALVFLGLVWAGARRGAYGPGRTHVPETAAAFWHMVDLLWIVLFPLLYVMR